MKLYFLDDGKNVVAPESFALGYWNGQAWAAVPSQTRAPARPTGHRANVVSFPQLGIQKLRVTFVHSKAARTGLAELDFGEAREVSRLELCLYDDRGGVQPPASYTVQSWTGSEWRDLPGQVKSPAKPTGSAVNTVTFPRQTTTRLRVVTSSATPCTGRSPASPTGRRISARSPTPSAWSASSKPEPWMACASASSSRKLTHGALPAPTWKHGGRRLRS